MDDHENLTIHDAQVRQPWRVPYSESFLRGLYHNPHNHATHAILHAQKSLGKISAVLEAIDHREGGITDEERHVVESMAADLFTVALRLANLYSFNLAYHLVRRVKEKNGVDIREKPPVSMRARDRADISGG